MPKIYAYVRVSTKGQELASQIAKLKGYAKANAFVIDEFVEDVTSADKPSSKWQQLFEKMQRGDALFVTELSRLSRNFKKISALIDQLSHRGIDLRFISALNTIDTQSIYQKINDACRENDTGAHDRVMIIMLSLYGDIEKSFCRERTKAALDVKRASGIKLGKPPGALQKSKLDPHKNKIIKFLSEGRSGRKIAEIIGCDPTYLNKYIRTRGLREKAAAHHTSKTRMKK